MDRIITDCDTVSMFGVGFTHIVSVFGVGQCGIPVASVSVLWITS